MVIKGLFHNDRVFVDGMRDAENALWSLSEDNIVNPTEYQVVKDIVDMYKVDPVFLDVDHKKIESSSINHVKISIPFKGTPRLFLYKPCTRYENSYYSAALDVDASQILITIDIDNTSTPESANLDMESQISSIIECLNKSNTDARLFNGDLEKIIRSHVQDKRHSINHKNSIISSLGIPV